MIVCKLYTSKYVHFKKKKGVAMSQNISLQAFFSQHGPGKDLTVGQIINKGIDKRIRNKHIYDLSNKEIEELNQKTNNKFNDTLKLIKRNQIDYNNLHNLSNASDLNYLQYAKSIDQANNKASWTQYYEHGDGSDKKVRNFISTSMLNRMGLSGICNKKISDLSKKEMDALNIKTNNSFLYRIQHESIYRIQHESIREHNKNNGKEEDKESELMLSLKEKLVSGYKIKPIDGVSKDSYGYSGPGISSVEQATNYSKQYQQNGYISPQKTSSGTNKNADEIRNKIADGFKNKDFSR